MKLIIATIIWLIPTCVAGLNKVCLQGVYIIPIIALISASISSLFPNIFSMGVEKHKKANILEKLAPIAVVALIIVCISLIEQTYSTAILVSILLGSATTYIVGEVLR